MIVKLMPWIVCSLFLLIVVLVVVLICMHRAKTARRREVESALANRQQDIELSKMIRGVDATDAAKKQKEIDEFIEKSH